MREIVIEIGSEKATARLLDDKSPITCNKIWDALPFEGPANHAKQAGGEVFSMVPIYFDLYPREKCMYGEWDGKKFEPGDIMFWPLRSCVCIMYGALLQEGHYPTFAKITENLEGIQKEGLKVWKKQGKIMKIYKK